MAALARVKPGDARVAERVELYIAGVEIANGFGELTDAAEQRRRFIADMDLKEKLYGTRYPIDEEFLAALEHGIPDSAGQGRGGFLPPPLSFLRRAGAPRILLLV